MEIYTVSKSLRKLATVIPLILRRNKNAPLRVDRIFAPGAVGPRGAGMVIRYFCAMGVAACDCLSAIGLSPFVDLVSRTVQLGVMLSAGLFGR